MIRLEQPVTIRPGESWTASFRDFEDKRILILADSYGITIAEAARRLQDADGDMAHLLSAMRG